jgi:hypothetical protein
MFVREELQHEEPRTLSHLTMAIELLTSPAAALQVTSSRTVSFAVTLSTTTTLNNVTGAGWR